MSIFSRVFGHDPRVYDNRLGQADGTAEPVPAPDVPGVVPVPVAVPDSTPAPAKPVPAK